MRVGPVCPRCGVGLHAPGLWSSAWQCDTHGAVHPLQPVGQPTQELVRTVAARAEVPVWLPWPLPRGWLVTGLAVAGDERTGARAAALACSGPAPLGGVAELVMVAEEPGIGLGARFAGLDGPDGGGIPDGRAPEAKLEAAGHPTAMWSLRSSDDRAVYVGEALGCWVYAIVWPESAGFLLIDDFALRDLRDGTVPDLPLGALSPRLST